MKKYVYNFSEVHKDMKYVVGGKGANLGEMTQLGIPVPPGFIVSISACHAYYENNKQLIPEVITQITTHLQDLEKQTGKTFGDNTDPLLVSVRSGAATSMPGMMDTVLNLGLNKQSVEALAKNTQNPRFAYDSYRRFMQMFGNVVLGVEGKKFEHILHTLKAQKNITLDTELTESDLKELIVQYEALVQTELHTEFPQDPMEQLLLGVESVFKSWQTPRAILYRKLNNVPANINGTAVTVQMMVYGNKGETSGTGVCFSRDPSTGENVFYGEYLFNAQGEDVVAGVRTPLPIAKLAEQNKSVYDALVKIKTKLELHYKDMQDMEFTIEEGKLFILQTRNGKRTGAAALKIAMDMLAENTLTEHEALMQINPTLIDQLLHKQLDPNAKAEAKRIAKGLPASPGGAVGKMCFDAQTAHELAQNGEKVILVRQETSPEDLIGMNAAQGILTSRGGMTSHAAVVARGMGKCCVAGCSELQISEQHKTVTVDGQVYTESDYITLDGSTGEVFVGKLPVIDPVFSADFSKALALAKKHAKLQVKANADTPHDAKVAIEFGAQGIGLCRTEHMFFDAERILAVREMIIAQTKSEREAALAKIEPFQEADFTELFKALNGKPIIIRLLDPPLHEFLPQDAHEIQHVADALGVSKTRITDAITSLHEVNPMLGFRGCRLSIKYPEITQMQVRAILKAAQKVENAQPWIEVPLVGAQAEYLIVKRIIESVAKEIDPDNKLQYKIGSMIETPRAAFCADELAPHCAFMSFGTNDLTQMTCGFSRDDAGHFLSEYVQAGIYNFDPFQTIDVTGVGKLMQHAVTLARSVNPYVHIGICGEHGGDPQSILFCHKLGLNEVSCSPYRVPVALLCAAQAAIKDKVVE